MKTTLIFILFMLSTVCIAAEVPQSGSIKLDDTTNFTWYPNSSITSVVFDWEKDTITVVRRYPANYMYDMVCGSSRPNCNDPGDTTVKTIYGIKNGKLVVIKSIHGHITPWRRIPERTVWEDEEP